jgi:L-serine/L-threonine ammonia-lyase
VIVHGKVWDEAHQRAMELAQGADTEFVPAFDHPVLWQGHSTMVDEILEDCPQVDALVTSVGGGGLLAGLDHPAIAQAHDVVIVVCGGVSITPALVAGWSRHA